MLSLMSKEILGDMDLEKSSTISRANISASWNFSELSFFQKAHMDIVAETRVTSIGSLLSITRDLTPLQLLYNALT